MPGRVTAFFRQHSNHFDLPVDVKKSARRNSHSRPSFSDRSPSSSGSSLASEDRSVKMPDSHKRMSLHLSSPKASSTKIPQHAASLDVVMESPPLVLYGVAANSSGALLSGQIVLNIHEDFLAIETFKMKLNLEVTRKKPFHNHCPECSNQSTELTPWKFLEGPATLRRGEHSFPFSCVIPGHLPASMKGALESIEYVLRATMAPKAGGEPLKLVHKLDVKRAICPAETPRHSIRIFPPTNLTANCELPSVIHPIGESNISMRIDGVVKRNVDTKTQTQWKLKRVTWRLDETQKMISPACAKHSVKASEEQKKGVAHQDVRTIGTDELKSGWKSDYNSPDGNIDLEFPISIKPESKPICDMKAEDGTEVSHVLIVEMIVAEEFAPIKKPTQITPTGAARVLRMHFTLTLTERAGLGISWDEEAPPTYENVPASPPGYGNSEAYRGPAIPDYEDLSPLDVVDEESNAVHEPLAVRRPSHSLQHTITLEDLTTEPH